MCARRESGWAISLNAANISIGLQQRPADERSSRCGAQIKWASGRFEWKNTSSTWNRCGDRMRTSQRTWTVRLRTNQVNCWPNQFFGVAFKCRTVLASLHWLAALFFPAIVRCATICDRWTYPWLGAIQTQTELMFRWNGHLATDFRQWQKHVIWLSIEPFFRRTFHSHSVAGNNSCNAHIVRWSWIDRVKHIIRIIVATAVVGQIRWNGGCLFFWWRRRNISGRAPPSFSLFAYRYPTFGLFHIAFNVRWFEVERRQCIPDPIC